MTPIERGDGRYASPDERSGQPPLPPPPPAVGHHGLMAPPPPPSHRQFAHDRTPSSSYQHFSAPYPQARRQEQHWQLPAPHVERHDGMVNSSSPPPRRFAEEFTSSRSLAPFSGALAPSYDQEPSHHQPDPRRTPNLLGLMAPPQPPRSLPDPFTPDCAPSTSRQPLSEVHASNPRQSQWHADHSHQLSNAVQPLQYGSSAPRLQDDFSSGLPGAFGPVRQYGYDPAYGLWPPQHYAPSPQQPDPVGSLRSSALRRELDTSPDLWQAQGGAPPAHRTDAPSMMRSSAYLASPTPLGRITNRHPHQQMGSSSLLSGTSGQYAGPHDRQPVYANAQLPMASSNSPPPPPPSLLPASEQGVQAFRGAQIDEMTHDQIFQYLRATGWRGEHTSTGTGWRDDSPSTSAGWRDNSPSTSTGWRGDSPVASIATTRRTSFSPEASRAPPSASSSSSGAVFSRRISSSFEARCDRAGAHLLNYILARRKGQRRFVERERVQLLAELQQNRSPDFDKFQFWVELLHQRALTSKGSNMQVFHENVDRRALSSVQSIATGVLSSTLKKDEVAALATLELQQPSPEAKMVRRATLAQLFSEMSMFLQRNGIEPPSAAASADTLKVLSFLADALGWYSSSRGERLWLTDAQVARLVVAIWHNAHVGEDEDAVDVAIELLCRQLLALILNQRGLRQTSLVESSQTYRKPGQMARFLRWRHVAVRFFGHTKDGRPIFIVFGAASGSKNAQWGDTHPTAFTFSNLVPEDIVQDTATVFVLLALISKAYGAKFERALFDVSAGQEMLSKGRFVDFFAEKDLGESAVFVERKHDRKKSSVPLHELDIVTPAMAALNMCPMLQGINNGWETRASEAAGLAQSTGPRIWRRSHCVKEKLDGQLTSTQLADEMGHRKGDTHLVRYQYAADHDPVAPNRYRVVGQLADESLRTSVQHLDVVRNRLADNIDEADLDILRSKASAVADVIESEANAREEGRPTPSSWETSPEADALVIWWASISDGRMISAKEALRESQLLLDGTTKLPDLEHPFLAAGRGGDFFAALSFLRGASSQQQAEPQPPRETARRSSASSSSAQSSQQQPMAEAASLLPEQADKEPPRETAHRSSASSSSAQSSQQQPMAEAASLLPEQADKEPPRKKARRSSASSSSAQRSQQQTSEAAPLLPEVALAACREAIAAASTVDEATLPQLNAAVKASREATKAAANVKRSATTAEEFLEAETAEREAFFQWATAVTDLVDRALTDERRAAIKASDRAAAAAAFARQNATTAEEVAVAQAEVERAALAQQEARAPLFSVIEAANAARAAGHLLVKDEGENDQMVAADEAVAAANQLQKDAKTRDQMEAAARAVRAAAQAKKDARSPLEVARLAVLAARGRGANAAMMPEAVAKKAKAEVVRGSTLSDAKRVAKAVRQKDSRRRKKQQEGQAGKAAEDNGAAGPAPQASPSS